MLRLTNLADYAVVVMATAARHPGAKLSAATVAAASGIPAPTVAKLMGTLARAGLLVSHRGVAGGFGLSRAPEAISVADIVEAVDGPIAITQCCSEGRADCGIEGSCGVRVHWTPINRAVREALAAVPLSALVRAQAAASRELVA